MLQLQVGQTQQQEQQPIGLGGDGEARELSHDPCLNWMMMWLLSRRFGQLQNHDGKRTQSESLDDGRCR